MIKKFKKAIKILKEEGITALVLKTIIFLKNKSHSFCGSIFFFKNKEKIIKELKNFHSDSPNEIFDFISKKYFGVFGPAQDKEEFIRLLEIFKTKKPERICEIGTANGGTLFCFAKSASDNATIMSIDLPGGEFGGGYPEWKIPIYRAFAKSNQKISLLREDSHKMETLEKVKKILNGEQIDFLFIDGDHSYEGVKKDFEMYGPLVKKGGIVSFHDIATISFKECEVPKFWQEIKSNYDYREFVKDLKESNFGIGVLFI